MNGLFVTATDTGVGKTAVTAALALALRARGVDAGVAKPVQSGARADDPDGDASLLARLAGVDDPIEEICPYAFEAPLAPLVAARLESRSVDADALVGVLERLAARHDALLVEGAGGLLVPVGEDWTIADLAARLELPLVLVARAGLGTVNHTLLTLAEARRRGLDTALVVLNGPRVEGDHSPRTNGALIETFGDVSVLGPLPWLDVPVDAVPAALAARLDLDPIFHALRREEAARA